MMESIIIILISVLLVLNVLLFLKFKKEPKKDEDSELIKIKDDIGGLKESFTESFSSMSREVAKDMTGALTRVDEKVKVFNQQVGELSKSNENFTRILAGVKHYGVLAEFSLASLLKDLLPSSQYLENVKMKPEETSDTVEFAIKLEKVLIPLDSHFPVERYKAIDEAFQNKDKDTLAEARKDLAQAFRTKAKAVNEKYIAPPKTTDFALVYAPTEGLFAELSSYRDPKTKELLLEELRKKYKVTITGPNTLSALLQSYQLGFQTLKVQKHATQIYGDLRNITSRFEKHFMGIADLRKKLDQAMKATDSFGRDARSIMRTLENIKDPTSKDDPKLTTLKSKPQSSSQDEESVEEKIEKIN